MRKLLFVFSAVALGLAGCGGDTCSSRAADVGQIGACGGTLAPSTTVTIAVKLCANCSDSSPTCTGEIVSNEIQLDAAFQECQADASCPPTAPACSSIPCTVQTPPNGTFNIVAQSGGSTIGGGSVTISPGGTTNCPLL